MSTSSHPFHLANDIKNKAKYSTLHVGKDSQLAYSIRLDFERSSILTLLFLRGENSPSWNPNASLMTSSGPISVHCTCLHHQPSKPLATSLHVHPSLVQTPKPSRIIAYLWVPSKKRCPSNMKHRPIARALCLPTLACKEQAELLSLHHHPPRTIHRKRVTTIAVSPADLRFVAALALHFWQFWPGGCHILRAWKSEPVVVLTIRRKERLRLQCKINCIKHWQHWISFPAHSSQQHATKPLFKNFGVRLFEVI